MALRSTPVHEGWTVAHAGPARAPGVPDLPDAPVPATVPGAVHTDLLAAGLVPDPYRDRDELVVDWVGRQDWAYRTAFAAPAAAPERVDLVCEGLDTVATVRVNGTEVARTADMHRTFRWPVQDLLVDGENSLEVVFTSAWTAGEAERERLGARPSNYPGPYAHLRKMACSFGWDWGPTTATCGIWRPVSLQAWSTARLDRVRPLVDVRGSTGTARFAVDLERSGAGRGRAGSGQDADLVLTARVAGVVETVRVPPGRTTAEVEVVVADPRRWWPHGLGQQPLYDAEVVLAGADGAVLDTWARRIGFRTVRLDTAPDEDGTPFRIVVNDVAVPVRGANWIPDDAFPHRVDAARVRARVAQATGANLNLLRVWGGGVFESDDFYDACDEAGVLVWQDFLFACAAYPEEEPLRSEVEAEARDNVARLMPHPSLVLWNGNNENTWGWFDWGWQEPLAGRTWGAGYYLDVLPRVVAEVDPTRPYWAGSPYSGSMDAHPNDPAHGCTHLWDVWNEVDYTAYREHRPRFVSEFGWQGPPAWSTLRRAVRDDPMTPDSPGVAHHQKANDGTGKLERGLAPHFPTPTTVEDWHWATQLNQARAMALGIEHFRSLRPLCTGTIVWQLNDCWPAVSWAAVDGDGRLKPLWFALRAAYATRLLTVQPRGGGLALVGVNDGGETWREPVLVRRLSFDGQELASWSSRLVTDRFGAATLALPEDLAAPGDPARELLVATTPTGVRALWFFAEDRDLAYAAPRCDVAVERGGDDPDTARVSVTAAVLVRDLSLFPDRVTPAATADSCLVTLLPGERHVFTVTGLAGVDDAALAALVEPPVLRSANDLVVGREPRAAPGVR